MSETGSISFGNFLASLPEPLRPLAQYVHQLRTLNPIRRERELIVEMRRDDFDPKATPGYFSKFTDDEIRLAVKVEKIRAEITQYEKNEVYSFSSSFVGLDEGGNIKPGKVAYESTEYQASVGSKPNKGVLLKRVAEAFASKRLLELGTNTGLGSCYMAAASSCEKLVTIEGSSDLAEIADHNIKQTTDKCEVVNAFFSDAISEMQNEDVEPFDFVYIDGQHHKDAMIHYMNQAWPITADVSVFVFDDIYWSKGMNDAWQEIVRTGRFAYVAEIDSLGLGVRRPGDEANVHYDFSSHIKPRQINAKRANR